MRTDHKSSFSCVLLARSRHHFVQLAARLGIRLHLPIPIVVRPGMKQRLQLATLLRRELLNRPLDFSNRAHGTKLSGMHYGVNSRPCPDPTPRLLQAQSTLNPQQLTPCWPAHRARRRSLLRFQLSVFSVSAFPLAPSTNLTVCFPSPRLYARRPAQIGRASCRERV